MKTTKAHLHTYDLNPNDATRVQCTQCGFGVPLFVLASRVNLESITARANATPRVREALQNHAMALRGRML